MVICIVRNFVNIVFICKKIEHTVYSYNHLNRDHCHIFMFMIIHDGRNGDFNLHSQKLVGEETYTVL